MEVIHTIEGLRSTVSGLKADKRSRNQTDTVGFVPTMGYLHEGHMSLMEKARVQCGIVVLSIFVNPLQFGPNEDLASYPRDEQRDLKIAEQMKVDVVFMPNAQEMYPQKIRTTVSVSELTERLCGASRPDHFDGVATVVMKLFHIVNPDRVYFGLKDAQQVAVIQQMIYDLNMNIELIACPILREADGLAMSSRNVYLSDEERKQALVLSQALQNAEREVTDQTDISIAQLHEQVRSDIQSSDLAKVDYIEILSYPSLEIIDSSTFIQDALSRNSMIIALAVKFGKTRLIDNLILAQHS
jgi:pantoate--beta-alanine ligase